MKVKLISYSKPTDSIIDEGIDNAQELVAFCARVSNPSNQLNTETSEKLINRLNDEGQKEKRTHADPINSA